MTAGRRVRLVPVMLRLWGTPDQPLARTSAMSFFSWATPTAPGTTVSPITKAGVPVIPRSLARLLIGVGN